MSLYRLLKFEIKKLFRQRSAHAAFIIVIAFSFLFFFLNYLSRPEGTYTGFDLIMETIHIHNSVLLLLPMVGILLAVQSIAEEISTGTLKTILTKPVKRENVLFSKFIALFCYMCVVFYAVLAVSFLCGLYWGYPEATVSSVPPLLLTYFWYMLGSMVLVAFTFFVASLGIKPITTAVISLGIHRLFVILEFSSHVQNYTFSHHVTKLIQISVQAFMGWSTNLREMWGSLTVILIYMLALLLAASILMERRDITA